MHWYFVGGTQCGYQSKIASTTQAYEDDIPIPCPRPRLEDRQPTRFRLDCERDDGPFAWVGR
jgi:hypothetical protein